MNKKLTYIQKIAVITFLIASVMLVMEFTSLKTYLLPVSWFILLFMSGLSILTYYLRSKSQKDGDAQDMYNNSMLATTARLLTSAVFLLVYFVKVKENLGIFVLNFFVIYFIYTAFEIRTLLPKLRTVSEKNNENK